MKEQLLEDNMKIKRISLFLLTTVFSLGAMKEFSFSKPVTSKNGFSVKVNCGKLFELYRTCRGESIGVEDKDTSPFIVCSNEKSEKLLFSYIEFKLCDVALNELREIKKLW